LIKLHDSVKHKSISIFYFNLTATNLQPSDRHHDFSTRKIKTDYK